MRSSIALNNQAVIVLTLLVLMMAVSCKSGPNLPKKSSKEYDEAIKTFYVSLAALQVGDDVRADSSLTRLTQLVPAEPAAWGNWGVLSLRQRSYDMASERLQHARELAPQNDHVQYLIGLLESGRGQSDQAIVAFRKAAELNPKNLVATYALAQELERLNDEKSLAEVQSNTQKLLAVQPANLAALIELARISAKRSDAQTLQMAVGKIAEQSNSWPAEVQQQLSAVRQTAAGPDLSAAATRIAFLRNVLVRVPEYRRDLAVIKPPPGEEAVPFIAPLLLEAPTFVPASPDTGLAFKFDVMPATPSGKWTCVKAISLDGTGGSTVVVANSQVLKIGASTYPFPADDSAPPTSSNAITPLDFNYDFKTDLVLTGNRGVRLLKQAESAKYVDVTDQTNLPQSVLNSSYEGAWAADIDADGDLDVVLGPSQGQPEILRNNGDGTFAELHPFPEISGLQDFVWADIDGDGDPDACLIDKTGQGRSGKLHIFSNERSGQFRRRDLPTDLSTIRAFDAADMNQDGILDLLVLRDDGTFVRIADKDEGQSWDSNVVTSIADFSTFADENLSLSVVDLDNNGANDLLLTTSGPNRNAGAALVWLGDKDNNYSLLSNQGPAESRELLSVLGAADLNADGRLDLIGVNADGQAVQALNSGTKNYHWQVIRPRAANAVGDQRINSFGVGGEMEIRAGLLVQKQLITGPIVHFGLGEQTGADVVRIVWPNGAVRAEFETQADQTILAEQRLKGSCPFLFAFDGTEMKFVKDSVPWGSAIGLRINTLGTARVEATEEWYKISGQQLAPRNGYYDLRITAELWETYYYDQLGLIVVDHPVGTDIFVDERFVIPPAKLAITTVSTPQKIAHAWDETGKEVTEVVSNLDQKYLDNFGRGRYQGVTRDHYVEIDLGNNVPTSGPLYLIAKGWMHPTDSSINVAISQGKNEPAKPLSLEVVDEKGAWIVANPNLGFPAGRNKNSLIDLTNVFRTNGDHRLRLRTNLEIYWDSIEWAQGLPNSPLKTAELTPDLADLHFRGFSVINKADDSSPEIPNYNQLSSSKQIWRDLIGYYTRFGDVRELLARSDDRYVIMNAGDEMTFRFREQQPPPPGWVRDFVITGDGWIKDGDYNSTFSKTVSPLPYHAKREYTSAPTRLEDEWVYKAHPEDWQKYHTRYVTPQVFRSALRN